MEVTVAQLTAAHTGALAELFARISADAAAAKFHPHPFTGQEAEKITRRPGKDIYLGLFVGGRQLGYGMLRGWNEGYDIPSLGIYLALDARGRGLSRILMQKLHEHARAAGARRIRLKVYPDNTRALRLYEDFGYRFEGEEGGQRVGYLELPGPEGRTVGTPQQKSSPSGSNEPS
jgi:ribosomal protein S18 acetylase RimI-like enzyme